MLKILFFFSIAFIPAKATLIKESDEVIELIKNAGYRGSAYRVETPDNGWLLKLHRVYPKRKMPGTIPVMLMHGLFVGSFDYLILGRNKALGYLLADNNFDVFLGNSRGNRHATVNKQKANHSTLWNFSFNEIGCYDVAAMIDYILNLTGAKRLFYVGHSQGTSSLMALLASRPEYNAKIIQAHLFAPASFMKNFPSVFLRNSLLPLIDNLEKQNAKILNFTDIFSLISPLSKFVCDQNLSPGTVEICKQILSLVAGDNPNGDEVEAKIIPTLVDYISWTLSFQQVNHYAQLYRSGKFRKYDFKFRNKEIYGRSEPPEYNLSNIIAPIYIYRAPADSLVSRRDIDHLVELLPNVKLNRVIPNYNHIDFNYGRRSRKLIFNDVLKCFQSESVNQNNHH